MKSKFITTCLLALCSTGALAAETSPFTANVGLVSDYLYRGISQSGAKPAIQGGFDYAHANGFYAGIWGSSISWLSDLAIANNAGVEFDTYVGFKNSIGDFRYDVGYLRYNYPGNYNAGTTDADTDEIYGAVGYKWFTAKYSHSLGDTFATRDADGTYYLDLSASYTIDSAGVTLGAHYGKQKFKGPNAGSGNTDLSYNDYKLSATKDFSGYVFGLAYSDTDASPAYTVLGKDLGKGKFVLSLTRSF